MKVHLYCDSTDHPVIPYLNNWLSKNEAIELLISADKLLGGDVLVLISCNEVLTKERLKKYSKTFVLHASDLPNGRGWSPHIWAIINGASAITLSLIEAEEKVDTGDIWLQKEINIKKTDLYDDINRKIFNAEIELISELTTNYWDIKPIKQVGLASYYSKRTPEDSELNVELSLKEQFDLLRTSDPLRYPAFFYYNDVKYNLRIEKSDI